MRFTGDVKFQFLGDKQRAMTLIPEARKYLGILLNDAQFNDLQQAVRRWQLPDGSIIEAIKSFNLRMLNIYVPPMPTPLAPVIGGGDERAYYFTLFKIDHPLASDGGAAMGYGFNYLGEIQRYQDDIQTIHSVGLDPYRGFILPNTKVIVASREPPPLDDSYVLQCFKLNYSSFSKIFLSPGAARPTYTTEEDVSVAFGPPYFFDIPIITLGTANSLAQIDNQGLSIDRFLNHDIDETQSYWKRDHIPGVSQLMGGRKIVSWCDLRSLDNNAAMDLAQAKYWMDTYNSNAETLGGRTVDSIVEIKPYTAGFTQGTLVKSFFTYETPNIIEWIQSNTLDPDPMQWTYRRSNGTTWDYYLGEYNQYEASVNDLVSRGGIASSGLDDGGQPAEVNLYGPPDIHNIDMWVLA
jgi:hypothetical protein